MGVKGRSGAKPKPNNLKVLSGSRRANKNAIEHTLIENVDPPDWLPDLAKTMWQTVCPHLCSKKVLAVTDLHNLEAFCMAYSRWRDAERIIASKGLVVEGAAGGPIKNPAVTVANEALKQMSSYGSALGLDPASRGRLIGVGSDKKINPFERF